MKIICIIRTETDRNVRNRNTIFPLPFDPKDFFSPTFPFPPSYRCIARAFTVAFQPGRHSNSNFEPGPLIARGFARLANQQPGARGTCACDPHSRSYATETGRGEEWRTWTGRKSRGELNETRSIYPLVYLCLHLHSLLLLLQLFLSNKAEKLGFRILLREEETICAEENYLDSDEI